MVGQDLGVAFLGVGGQRFWWRGGAGFLLREWWGAPLPAEVACAVWRGGWLLEVATGLRLGGEGVGGCRFICCRDNASYLAGMFFIFRQNCFQGGVHFGTLFSQQVHIS